MGKIVLWGALILGALIFLPGLLSGGAGGAKDAGGKAGSDLADKAKDPQAVVDGAGNVIAPVKEYAGPWYEYAIHQPWFIPALMSIGATIALVTLWRNMAPRARYIVIAIGVFGFVMLAIGFAK